MIWQCSRKNFHGSWDSCPILYILLKFMKSLIRHLALAIGNVRHVWRFSWTLDMITMHKALTNLPHIFYSTVSHCCQLNGYFSTWETTCAKYQDKVRHSSNFFHVKSTKLTWRISISNLNTYTYISVKFTPFMSNYAIQNFSWLCI